jgi:hypothetical protein
MRWLAFNCLCAAGTGTILLVLSDLWRRVHSARDTDGQVDGELERIQVHAYVLASRLGNVIS